MQHAGRKEGEKRPKEGAELTADSGSNRRQGTLICTVITEHLAMVASDADHRVRGVALAFDLRQHQT